MHRYEVSRQVVGVTDWPAEPLKVALISDVHAGPFCTPARLAAVVAHINAEKADLVLIAGDLTAHADTPDLPQLLQLSGLRSRLGTFAVLGNHDYYFAHRPVLDDRGLPGALMAVLREARIDVLSNEVRALLPGVSLLGIDSVWAGRWDIRAALEQLPPNTYPITLIHEPDGFGRLAKAKLPLVLAGHTHAGQIHLPGFGAIYVTPDLSPERDSPISRRRQSGWFERDGSRLFVTRGTGETTTRVRLLCRPEISLLTFKRADGA